MIESAPTTVVLAAPLMLPAVQSDGPVTARPKAPKIVPPPSSRPSIVVSAASVAAPAFRTARSPAPGTPAGVQLAPSAQLPLPPNQVWSPARAGVAANAAEMRALRVCRAKRGFIGNRSFALGMGAKVGLQRRLDHPQTRTYDPLICGGSGRGPAPGALR